MASIISRVTKKRKVVYDVFFALPSGERGKVSGIKTKSAAEIFGAQVESLIKMRKFGVKDFSALAWLQELAENSPKFYDRLVSWGLAEKRVVIGTIQDLVTEYTNRKDLKKNTLLSMERHGTVLIEFFGPSKKADSFNTQDVKNFEKWVKLKFSTGSLKNLIIGVRAIFNIAVSKKWIKENPFYCISARYSKVNRDRMFFVSEEISRAVLEELNTPQSRLAFALARYGGLRMPSEIQFMDWEDVHFDKNFFVVKSPKKTHKEQEERGEFTTRRVPLFPELRRYFMEYWETLPEGAEARIFDVKNTYSYHKKIRRAIQLAGITPWPKLFQNLRSTRETELADAFPIQDVTEWLGNTPTIARKHYLQARFEVLERAAQFTGSETKKGGIKGQILELAKNLKTPELLDLIEALKEVTNYERIRF